VKAQTDCPNLNKGAFSADKGQDGALSLSLSGRLDASATAAVWTAIDEQLNDKSLSSVTLEASGIDYCDGAGLALLMSLKRAALRRNIPCQINELAEDYSRMLKMYPEERLFAEAEQKGTRRDFVESVGRATVDLLGMLKAQITFIGELAAAFVRTARNPAGLRWKDVWRLAEDSGVRALPIIGMLGFLMGLIMAFQGAIPMRQFGADIFVADLVGISVIRELGPLITAIIMAGRTGSAYAAELGTMKVNEEIDALTTMGLDPMSFLVVPRVLAATVMTPLLAVFASLFGLAGGAVVMMGLGYPLITYVNRVCEITTAVDFTGGLFKAVAFGLLVGASGCLCGLKTGEGAQAVGDSATRAVVSSIILIVLADGLFAVLFFFLGI